MRFHEVTKSLAKQLDPKGELIPLHCIVDQNSFRPFFLVERKPKTSYWQTCPFHKTDFKLCDVLLPGHLPAQIDVKGSYTIVDQVDGTLEGTAGEKLKIANAEVMGSMKSTHTRFVKVKKIQVHSNFLVSEIGKEKINMDHEFIKQTKKHQKNLYVITEAIETVEEGKFEETSNLEGKIFQDVYAKMFLMGTRKKQTKITIPKSCILAFRAKKLEIQNDGSIDILHYADEKAKTFSFKNKRCADHQTFASCPQHHMVLHSPSLSTAVLRFSPTADFKIKSRAVHKTYQADSEDEEEGLEAEISRECKHFSLLAPSLSGSFLTGFVAIMKEDEKDLLHTLDSQLEQALEDPEQFKLKTSEPELQSLVDNLHDCSGAIIIGLAEAVLYFLEALNELTKFQISLLVDSVEKMIVSKQLVLVENILDDDFNKKEESSTVGVQFLTEDDLNITGVMMEMSEVTVQKNGSNLIATGRPADLSNLSALYVALYVLNLLSK